MNEHAEHQSKVDEHADRCRAERPKWGPGPWSAEPDRETWTTAAGFPAIALRNQTHGHWCGYVAVPPGHPWHAKDYAVEWDEPARPEVHGGVTYNDRCFGPICHVPAPGEPDDVWWIGFDCAHLDDASPRRVGGCPDGVYRTIAFVRRQCESLAAQAKAVAP